MRQSREHREGNEGIGDLSAKCHRPILVAFYVRGFGTIVRVCYEFVRRRTAGGS